MSDIATLGLAVDSTQVTQASKELDNLAAAGDRAQVATSKLSGEVQRQTAAMQTTVAATMQSSAEIKKAEAAALSFDRQLQQFLSTNDRVYAAQLQLDKGNDLITEGFRKGLLSQAQYDRALESLTARYAATASGADVLAKAQAKAAAESAAAARSVETLLTSVDKGYASSQAFSRGQNLLSDALKSGTISQATFDLGLKGLTTKYGPAAEGVEKLGKAHAGAAIPAGMLTRELRAVGDEIAAGRYKQLEGTLALLTTRFLGLGPVGLAVGGIIAGVGVAIGLIVAHGEEMARMIKTVETGFAAAGNSALLGETQIKAYIDTLALLPGVSRDSAGKAVEELSRVPYITGPLFDKSTKILADFSAMLGVDVPKGAKVLAGALDDPFKAAETLDRQFNLLSVNQRLLIDSFQQSGDKASALAILMGALEDRSKGLADRGLTPMQKASNDVERAWDGLLKTFGDSGAINTAGNALAGLIEIAARGIAKIGSMRETMKGFYAGVGESLKAAAAQSEMGASELPAPSRQQTAPRGTYRASDNYGEGASPSGSGDATDQAAVGQAEKTRALLDRTNFLAKVDQNKQLRADESELKKLLDSGNLSLEARAQVQQRIAGIEERLARGPKAKVEPLGLNVDRAHLEATLKVYEVAQAAEKAQLAERLKYIEFYHRVGITNDADYNKAIDRANDEYLAAQQATFAKEIAAVQAHEAQLKALKPVNKAQSDQRDSAVLEDEKKLVDLRGKEAELSVKIAADNQFRAATAPVIKAQEDFNRALKETQEITAGVTAAETKVNLEVQLGIKTQYEGIRSVTEARQAGIEKLQAELATLVAIHDASALATDSTQYIAQAKAIDDINIKLLKMQAELDPIGQKINGIINTGLSDFLDKIGSGGVKSFKDLRSAAKGFFDDITKQILHLVNQDLAGQIAKSLGLGGNSSGGIGGFVSSKLFGSGSGSSLFSGGASLFAGSSSALASTASTAGSSINAGIADEALALFHSGGIVGEASSTRQVQYTSADVAAAPRFHSGGIAGLNGYNEQLAVLQKGEEILTSNDPRHRSNGGKGGRVVNQTVNFNVARDSTLRPNSVNQIAGQLQLASQRGAQKVA